MMTIEERITKAKENVARLERERRLELKKEREAKKKKDQHRNYIIGELVTKYFPEVLKFEPGTKAENAVIFEPLEEFLAELAANQELLKQLKQRTLARTSKSEKLDC